MLLPIILLIRIAMFPGLPPIEAGRFESEKECAAAAAKVDASTPVILVLTCEIDT